MKNYKFDVVIVGAGPAGVTAAGTLAGSGMSVALLEAGVYAGAENWSGCVYFAESLAEPDCFGPAAVEAAPYERRVVKRGTLLHNGLDAVGVELADASIFRNCYTVLRPVYDPYFANLASQKGAVHITGMTVTSLIRKDGRVIGVQTHRGPLYAEVVFIAEGDASHLVRSEQLERVPEPHYLQGVKAVLTLPPQEIEKRFNLNEGEGCAYEILLRNAQIAGRTARLNVGGFLYTNKDSLSLGYVLPLDNLKDHYKGDHDRLFEWMRGLPFLRELAGDAKLSAYGTKIVRSGGWTERPVLVEDGLVVGGASAGLGVDIPFPNFTGPASATGLLFARAAKSILGRGRTPDAKNLTREYLSPLRDSVYGKNAQYLSKWPRYFGKSSVLFGRTVDMACGSARFLSTGGFVETSRFLRGHILSLRGLRESITDAVRAAASLRLWKPIAKTIANPVTWVTWVSNMVPRTSRPRDRLGFGIVMEIGGRRIEASSLPRPLGPFLTRLSPALAMALREIYSNDAVPAERKFPQAAEIMIRSLNITDFFVLPFTCLVVFLLSLITAAWDAFRFYVLRTPVTMFLAEPVMAYNESQRKARDLDAVRPATGFEAKLATNTYRVGSGSHIRTLWPDMIASQSDMSRASLWWVCPARVYVYDAPLAGRGKVTVNFENCIKCESCWRAEPRTALWGRHTDHRLIYRPESGAIPALLENLKSTHPQTASGKEGHGGMSAVDERLWNLNDETVYAAREARNSSAAFTDAVSKLPASADPGRKAWPTALGKRLALKLLRLESALANNGLRAPARLVQSNRKDIEERLAEGRLFYALYCCCRLEQQLDAWMPHPPPAKAGNSFRPEATAPSTSNEETDGRVEPALTYEKVSSLFPDRVVKSWEEEPLPKEWAAKLHRFISEHADEPLSAVRVLSSVNPALGIIAARQFSAMAVLKNAGITLGPGVSAADAGDLEIRESIDAVHLKGSLHLVPLAASHSLLILARGRGHLVPLSGAGVTIAPMPSIGFRAAGLSDVTFDCSVKKYAIAAPDRAPVPEAASYLAVALGAGDYLCKRVKEHALGRVQFPGQMLDTEGRDGIAKLGAVKAMIARTEAWRLLLETLFDSSSAFRILPAPGDNERLREYRAHSEFDLVISTLSAMAFSPEPGSMGYDAGQVFGGFAYSEDDLLSRFYRDSALFRFLAPGYGAAETLNASSESRTTLTAVSSQLASVRDEPLGAVVKRLIGICGKCQALPENADPLLAGQAKALVIGIQKLLVKALSGLESGKSAEAESAASEVLIGLARETLGRAALSCGRGRVSPAAYLPLEPAGKAAALDFDYESFCTAPGMPHQSGSFLTTAFERSARFVPEIQLHDPRLRGRWEELAGWFRENCRDREYDGLFIERYIEKIHGIPPQILAAVKERRWLATYVPKALDGLEWRKAEYYILNAVAGCFGDAGINLLIMASTSIGTTPILLGLDEELPRVREELAPLAGEAARLGEIGERISGIVASFERPDPVWIKKEYESVMALVDDRIRRTRVVKYLAANFLRAFYGAGLAGRRGDFNGFMANLGRAGELFERVMPDVRAALDELPRRERCHRLFLRTLGHGAVSAFALTEPTAGSDSGGVKTTAKLQSAKLVSLEDGRYSFRLDEGDGASVRYLIDADGITFSDSGAAYRTPDGGPYPILYDRYDYATDEGVRYYRSGDKVCEFHDIGQVRMSADGPRYEYYSLTGAKMWITNGSIATQFSLYAQTSEGVTGFLVDRHAEGLKVGADEKKMGQRGSPTNEISLDSVRVPREAVIGYEGHGQVNALETLNVGRCGLAVVSGALMRKLLEEASRLAPVSASRDLFLGEAAAVLFGSESLAFYLIGLFDRPHESVRMESAIAKYACSEDLHELLSLVEQAYGPSGQTEKFLVEKARRDARILTIYEGTNEVQRFLILKDLIARAGAWSELVASPGDEPASTLALWKNRLRQFVRSAADALGDTAWSDAMLQPALFPLAEMAAEILRLECIYYRMEWLGAHKGLPEQSGAGYALVRDAGMRAAERTVARLEGALAKFEDLWEEVRGNKYPAEVRAADASLDKAAAPADAPAEPVTPLLAPLRVLSILRSVADLSPSPGLTDGSITEIVWEAESLDLSGLSQTLRLKARSSAKIEVDALLVGGPGHEQVLRTAAAGADRFLRLEAEHSGPAELADAVRMLEIAGPYDLITIGARCLDGQRGVGAYLAGALGRRHSRKDRLAVRRDGLGLEHVTPPAVVETTERASHGGPRIARIVEAASARVTLLQTSVSPAVSASPRFERPAAAGAAAKTMTTVTGAAEYLAAYAARARSARAEDYRGAVVPGGLPHGSAVWAALDPRKMNANAALLCTGRQIADAFEAPLNAVISAPRAHWPQLAGLAHANGADRAFCVDTGQGMLSVEGKRDLSRVIADTADRPVVLGGPYWTDAFGIVAGELAADRGNVRVLGHIGEVASPGGGAVLLSIPAYEGRLIRKERLEPGTAFLTVAPDAGAGAAEKRRDFAVAELKYPLSEEWLMPLPAETGPTLTQTDVIISLGYGIKDRAGLELAQELKKKLEALGLAPLFGATRKVTQDLKLLPLEAQIGQTGVRVNPNLIIALGVSGAPQHIDYVGTRAEILCFNKDPDAPLMKLNESRPAPRVHPIAGDLFTTVRELIEKLK